MSDLALTHPDSSVGADLAALETSELRLELAKALRITVESIQRLASIVRLLDERGEDLSDLKIGLLDYLRRIAHNQVVAELVVRYADSPQLLRTLAALPIPDQRRLAAGEPVPMMLRRPDGSVDTRMVDPLKMTRDQIGLVFGRGKIRDQAEQVLRLESRQAEKEIHPSRQRKGSVHADQRRGGLVVGSRFVPTGVIVSALAELAGQPDDATPDIAFGIKLTEAEHIALKNAASRAGLTMNVLIRRALLQAGLFAGE